MNEPVATTTLSTPAEKTVEPEDFDCSCVKYARSKIPSLPRMRTPADLPLSTTGMVGGATVFEYNGVWHIGVNIGLEDDAIIVDEWNYRKCSHTVRRIPFDDPAIRGYWNPDLTNVRAHVSLPHENIMDDSAGITGLPLAVSSSTN